jgi:hypothetical protein
MGVEDQSRHTVEQLIEDGFTDDCRLRIDVLSLTASIIEAALAA